MRHGKKFNHLGRTTSHRKAMLSNMACSLIEHKRINTTVAKAKALRQFIEPILTKSKTDSTQSRRIVFRYLQNKYAVTELFREVSPKIAERNGGYTRIIRTGARLGDNAEMCLIELVDFNELMLQSDTPAKKTTRRSRRGGGAKTTEAVVETAVEEKAEVKEDTSKDEVVAKEKKEAAPKAKKEESPEKKKEEKADDSKTDEKSEE